MVITRPCYWYSFSFFNTVTYAITITIIVFLSATVAPIIFITIIYFLTSSLWFSIAPLAWLVLNLYQMLLPLYVNFA